MEDYKEKYEMALEGIQEILSSGQDSIKMPQLQLRLQGIFPELKESEDEKVRKALIKGVESCKASGWTNFGNNVDIDVVLAWLEKQGDKDKLIKELGEYKVKYTQEVLSQQLEKQREQKPVDVNSTLINKMVADYSNTDEYVDGNYIGKPVNCQIRAYRQGINDALNSLKIEKQGVQKPVDKIRLEKKYKCIASPRYSTFMVGKIYKPEDKFLCSLMNFYSDCFEPIEDSEQEPAWSEEDSKRIDYICDFIWKNRKGDTDEIYQQEQDVNWLKSLKERVQPQNNSITDEELEQAKKDAYNDALDKIEYHSGEPTFADGWHAAIDCIKKKSFKPNLQWKPSDEQMDALLGIMIESGFDYIDYNTLESLYNDLKKL